MAKLNIARFVIGLLAFVSYPLLNLELVSIVGYFMALSSFQPKDLSSYHW